MNGSYWSETALKSQTPYDMSSKNVNSVSGPDAVEARATRESIGWVPVLFGFTIFVMLSTPMAFALTSGVDPYSIYMIDWGFGTWRTVFLSLFINGILTAIGLKTYLCIKPLIDWVSNGRVIPIIEHGFRASISALVFAVPIAVAYNDLKPYYLIAWVLASVFFGLMGAFAAQGSTLDRSNMTIYMVATVAIGLAFAGAGLLVLYFEDVAQFPPPHNVLWEFDMAVEYEKHLKEKGDDFLTDSQKEYREWVEDFPARHSNGRLIFGWVTIPYVFFAFVLGMWRATYEAWRRGSEEGAPDAIHPDPVEEVTHDQSSSSAPEPTSPSKQLNIRNLASPRRLRKYRRPA